MSRLSSTAMIEEGEPRPVRGAMDRLRCPVMIEIAGRPLHVISHAFRMELKIEHLWRQEWRDYWDVELEDGSRLTVYRDLTKGGWYSDPSAPERDPKATT